MKTIIIHRNPEQTSKKLASILIILSLFLVTKAQVTHNVSVLNNYFEPSILTIEAGDTVVWTNSAGFHNVNGTQETFAYNPESFGNSTGTDWTYSHVFNIAGTYDYQCNPHAGLGMTGQIMVTQDLMLTINFSGMTPHVGQNLWLSVIDKETGEEIERVQKTVEVDFSIEIMGILSGHSYSVDFFADHNGNGQYDAPPTDHAWRMDLNDVDSDETLNFAHNTNFTDIEWKNLLMIQFSGMNPHDGENLWLAVIDKETGEEIQRVKRTIEVDFNIDIYGIENGHSYFVNFFADHNGNGQYDTPSTDHAWQLEIDNVMGDDTLEFAHNTNFTDINWQNLLIIKFSAMNPHDGQDLWLAVIDKETGEEIKRVKKTVEVEFSIEIFGVEYGHSYFVNFFSDHNGNGQYDAPPTDHAWQLELNNVMGDDTLEFTHNTNFTDIDWQNLLMIKFSAMNPHVGQNLWLAVVDKDTDKEIKRIKKTVEVNFNVNVLGIENGHSYFVNFFADHNGNGQYDAPSTDHAWQLELNDVMGDDTLEFTHNTNFTDVDWKYLLTIQFTNMNPHIGQMLTLYLYDTVSAVYVDTITMEAISEAAFDIMSYAIVPGASYNIDFYADLSGNSTYDAPPTDHAWRVELFNVHGDTTINFEHNVEFTDIMENTSTGIEDSGISNTISAYPIPAINHITLKGNENLQGNVEVIIYNISGQIEQSHNFHNTNSEIELNINSLSKGLYFIKINTERGNTFIKFVKVD